MKDNMESQIMVEKRKTLIIFLLIMIQSILAITAGVYALAMASTKAVPSGVSAGGRQIGGLSYSEAAQVIEEEYSGKLQSNALKLAFDNGKIYELPFSQIEAHVDAEAMLDSLKSIKGIDNIANILKVYFGGSTTQIDPVIKLNESKLRMALIEISRDVNTEPVDAQIHYITGTVVKTPDTPGLSLNVANAAEFIKRKLEENPLEAIVFDSSDNYVLQPVNASVTMKEFDEIQQVLAEYTTIIKNDELKEHVQFAAEAINGVMLPAAAENESPQEFSFIEQLKKKSADIQNDNEGYDQVASTLYAALLMAGIPKDSIIRLPHELAPDYIEPGLDSWISGNGGDLKFTNPFSHKLAVFTELRDGRITVAVAGSMSDKIDDVNITTEIVQRFAPSVVYVENSRLKPGEKVVLYPGKEGIMVNVYRNDELISTDEYKAEKSIVQIAPNTDWNQESK